jgi:DNA-directed RNA polymerase specialized sigma24 family protein
MASCPGAESSLNEAGLAELVRRIQIGDHAAIRVLYSMFSAGIEFLLRRKLRKLTVKAETAGVLEAAVREIQKSASGQPVNLRGVVANIIRLKFPAAAPDWVEQPSDSRGASVADSVLGERTPLERIILSRYYVLGESPNAIRTDLGVSAENIEQVIASARTDFRRRVRGTSSV